MKFTIFSITEPKWMVGFLSVVSVMFHTFTSAQSPVEGFAGGAVTLPCTVNIQGDLQWKQGANLILIKPVNGLPTPSEGAWKDVVSLVDSTNNMRISSLKLGRDNNSTFTCRGTSGGGPQTTRVTVLARITGAGIDQADQGQVTVQESVPKTLTCTATGKPNPNPSYSWAVDTVQVSTQGSSYGLTANRSMKTVKCTATNLYSNGTVLSRVVAEAGLNVQYLDRPNTSDVTVIENDRVTLMCSAEGNPRPTFKWTRSQSVGLDVQSSFAEYTIENVERSDAGQYICTVTNSVGGKVGAPTTVIVQYPPDVNVTYDGNSRTLTCTAQGVPNTYTFSVWEHRLGGTLIRRLDTAVKETSVSYRFPHTLRYEDTGDYVCSVTNGIKSNQTGKTNLAPPTAAVFQNQTKIKTIGIGKTEMISVPFYTTASGNVQVKWEKSGESTALKSHQEEKGEVSLLVYGEMVSIEGTVTVLTLTDVSESDEGNYTVTVTSNINGVSEDKRISFYVNVTIVTETPGGGTTGEQGANLGLYIGSAAGGVALVMIIIFGAIVCWRRSHPRGRSDSKEEKTSVKLSQSEQLCPDGRGFSGSQWKEPDAEVVVNDLYESASFSRDLPPQDKRPPKPARTFEHNSVRVKDSQPSGAEPEMVMEENTLYDSADPKPGVKKNVATKPQKAVKPMRPAKPDKPQLPIDDSYELTGFSNTPGANNNNTPAKRPVLNYQEVSFDRTKDPSRVNTPRSPTNYSDISFKNKH